MVLLQLVASWEWKTFGPFHLVCAKFWPVLKVFYPDRARKVTGANLPVQTCFARIMFQHKRTKNFVPTFLNHRKKPKDTKGTSDNKFFTQSVSTISSTVFLSGKLNVERFGFLWRNLYSRSRRCHFDVTGDPSDRSCYQQGWHQGIGSVSIPSCPCCRVREGGVNFFWEYGFCPCMIMSTAIANVETLWQFRNMTWTKFELCFSCRLLCWRSFSQKGNHIL